MRRIAHYITLHQRYVLLFLPLQEKLGYRFKDVEHLRVALSHKSHANEGRRKDTPKEAFVKLHNERLEFLGDSVLGLAVTDLLMEAYPGADEGKLSRMRSILVKAATLAERARSIDLGSHLLLGKGERTTRGSDKESILSSSFEAVLGAAYLDGGFSAAHEIVKRLFAELLLLVGTDAVKHDTKTRLQEVVQARFRKSPVYKVVSEEGPDHEKTFEVMVSVGALKRYGKGRNKKEAEQAAAGFLLESLTEKIDAI
ncbi:MAG: ribonuclease III [Bdellovibrionales bacterium]|nr:ribonuclease III [Bdellovibrionales bacterium]